MKYDLTVRVRVRAAELAKWRSEAEKYECSVSALIRTRMGTQLEDVPKATKISESVQKGMQKAVRIVESVHAKQEITPATFIIGNILDSDVCAHPGCFHERRHHSKVMNGQCRAPGGCRVHCGTFCEVTNG